MNQNIFEEIKKSDNENEYWSARDLMPLLGYTKWQNFIIALKRAEKACDLSGRKVSEHFVQITRVDKVGTALNRSLTDYFLSRYASYLIAQNGDPRKEEIALAQTYFAIQSRKQEILQNTIEEVERLKARRDLLETEKEFAKTLFDHNVDGKGIGQIRSEGDKVLFGGSTTQAMKKKYRVKSNETLADYLPTVSIKAKDLATEITTVNTKQKNLIGVIPIKKEHMTNNSAVRKLLNERGIIPENLPPEEHIKKIEKRLLNSKIKKLDLNK